MFSDLAELEERIRDHLDEYRFYSRQSWVPPITTAGGDRIHDVVIVGAGQSGLALAYSLKLLGIRRITLIDKQDPDHAGPWTSFARMKTLRTPKNVTGPECGNPLLGFRSWFSTKYSHDAYDRLTFVSVIDWCDYLTWFRRVLDIGVCPNTTITSIEWSARDGAIMLTAADGRRFWARKACLATGITAPGYWNVPDELVADLPEASIRMAWEPIRFADFTGRDVAVIGAGASGFDNAVAALEAGCRSVAIFSRSAFPDNDVYFDLWRGRDDSAIFAEDVGSAPADLLDPLIAFNAMLPDEDRIAVLERLFAHGRSPANREYLSRVPRLNEIAVYEEMPVDRIDHVDDTDRLVLHSKGQMFEFDRVIFATGVRADLAHRPELSALHQHILTWSDAAGPGRPLPLGMGSYPKLGPGFQLQTNTPEAGYLAHIYSLADVVHTTVGLQSISHVASTVARHIGSTIYTDLHIAGSYRDNCRELA